MAQRARRTGANRPRARRYRSKNSGGGVKVFAAVFAAVVVAAAAVIFVMNFYHKTESNLEKTAYPIEYSNYVEKAAKEYDLEPALIYAVIRTESRFNPDAESSVGARGLMQLMPSSFEWLAEKRGEADKYTVDDLFNPKVNIDYGCYLLRYFYDYYGSEKCAVAAYNAGFTVSEWLADSNLSPDGMTLETIPYPETSEYVERVQDAKQKYIKIYFS